MYGNSRRDFIKFVVAGSSPRVARSTRASLLSPLRISTAPHVDGDHFEICHQVRDGHQFARPEPAKKPTSSSSAAASPASPPPISLRQGKDFLLLEKEAHFGGNAYQEEFDGQPSPPAPPTLSRRSRRSARARNRPRAAARRQSRSHHRQRNLVADTWRTGLDALAVSQRSPRQLQKIPRRHPENRLRKRVANSTPSRSPSSPAAMRRKSRRWWDGYGPSNWGATTEDTSAFRRHRRSAGSRRRQTTASASSSPAASAASPTNSSKSCSQNTASACSATRRSSPSSPAKTTSTSPISTRRSSTTVSAKAVIMCTRNTLPRACLRPSRRSERRHAPHPLRALSRWST